MPKPTSTIPPDRLALYEKVVATQPDIERKGASMPYTSLNGHMFSFVTPAGVMALRLPAAAREAFLARHQTKLCEQHGTVLKEYVEVPAALLAKTKALAKYFAESLTYVRTLKPKATTRKQARPKAKRNPV